MLYDVKNKCFQKILQFVIPSLSLSLLEIEFNQNFILFPLVEFVQKNKSKNEENHSPCERSVMPFRICLHEIYTEGYMRIAKKLNPLNLLCNPRAKLYEENEEGRKILILVLIY